jgi:hypothetical protein
LDSRHDAGRARTRLGDLGGVRHVDYGERRANTAEVETLVGRRVGPDERYDGRPSVD